MAAGIGPESSAFQLLNGSFESLQAGRLEDALFCFYAGTVRRQLEMGLFPPDDEDGDARSLFGMEQQLGAMMNKLALDQPDATDKALERLAAWGPALGKGFQLPWAASRRGDPATVLSVVGDVKANLLRFTHGMTTLIRLPEYRSAFEIAQRFDPATADDAVRAGFAQSMRTMLGMERERKIAGVATQYFEQQ